MTPEHQSFVYFAGFVLMAMASGVVLFLRWSERHSDGKEVEQRDHSSPSG